jgi:hypothetical protein
MRFCASTRFVVAQSELDAEARRALITVDSSTVIVSRSTTSAGTVIAALSICP